MRILVDTGAYHQNNAGDNAMLLAALQRLHGLWPNAFIQVLTLNPAAVKELYARAEPLLAQGRNWWFKGGWLPYPLEKGLGSDRSRRLRELMRRRTPRLAMELARRRARRAQQSMEPRSFLDALENADLFVVAGGGMITDTFRLHGELVLESVRSATHRQIPTAMLGHAIGPVIGASLRRSIQITFPQLDLLTLREKRAGLPLLREINAMPRNIYTTGDDAIEIAYGGWTERGSAIGVNVRVASYSRVGSEALPVLRQTFSELAKMYAAPLIPLPVSQDASDSDRETLRLLLAQDEELAPQPLVALPKELVTRVAGCRVVITGSYHAAVFALARGIPVVGLSRSDYYRDKFLGLRDQFGGGVWLVHVDAPDVRSRIKQVFRTAWSISDDDRRQLIQSAERQMESGQAAYRLLPEIVESRRAACRAT